MIPFLPFIAGAAVGVGAVMLLKNDKTKEAFTQGKEYVTGKVHDGVETVKAVSKCVSDKKEKPEEKPAKEA